MGTLTYPGIAPHIAAGLADPAEIATALQADPRTVRNLPIDEARTLLQIEWRLLYRGTLSGDAV